MGTLLFTPNTVLFEPKASDTLVIEHGTATYGVNCNMDRVITVGLYHDIAAIKTGDSPRFVKHSSYSPGSSSTPGLVLHPFSNTVQWYLHPSHILHSRVLVDPGYTIVHCRKSGKVHDRTS